jgi:hypothetical protein
MLRFHERSTGCCPVFRRVGDVGPTGDSAEPASGIGVTDADHLFPESAGAYRCSHRAHREPQPEPLDLRLERLRRLHHDPNRQM